MTYYTINKNFLINKNHWKKCFLYCSLLFFLPITGIEEMFSDLHWIPLARAILCILYILEYAKGKRVSIQMVMITFFCLFLSLSTILNQGYYIGAFYGQFYIIMGTCCFFETQIRKNKNLFLICLYRYCCITIGLNFISILMFPQGLYEDVRGITETNFLLGNYNSFICKILPALGVGYHLLQKEMISKKNYSLLWILVIATYYHTKSITSILGITILGVFLLFFNHKAFRIICNSVFYSISALCLSYHLAFKRSGMIFSFIRKAAGKSRTLSGRTVLWKKIIRLLPKSPVIGFGVHTDKELIKYFKLNYAGHAHNFLLQILYQTGIMGGILWGILLLLTINLLIKTSSNQISRGYGCAFFALLIMLSADFYGYATIFQIVLLINLICQDIYKESKIQS